MVSDYRYVYGVLYRYIFQYASDDELLLRVRWVSEGTSLTNLPQKVFSFSSLCIYIFISYHYISVSHCACGSVYWA